MKLSPNLRPPFVRDLLDHRTSNGSPTSSGHPSSEDAARFKIFWKDGDYYVSIPNYVGGDVVRGEAYDALVKALTDIIEANKDFRDGMPQNWDGDPLQDACDAAAKLLARVQVSEVSDDR